MSKKRILIIDDDNRNIFALNATLRAKGFDCVSCTRAKDGLNLLKSDEKIDAVLLDMMMPEMDGYQAIPEIKLIKKRVGVPIIAVTAQAMQGDKEKCLRAGADGYISKPINVDTLLEVLTQFNVTG